MKHYVVFIGRETGIFTDWNACKKQTAGFSGAKHKAYASSVEAEAALQEWRSVGRQAEGITTQKADAVAGKVKTYSSVEVRALAVDTKIFTDGGCEPNPGMAGSGVAVYRQGVVSALKYGLFNPAGTNNTAELNALHQALLIARDCIGRGESVAIFCDSTYSIQCLTEWAAGWKANGWKKKGGEIKNLDLIKEMYPIYEELNGGVKILHVNGHVGVEGNELADRMSMLAIETHEVNFVDYRQALDIGAILAMRAG